MVFGFFKRGDRLKSMPVVKFDARRVTVPIRIDLWERIQEFEDLPIGTEAEVFEAALIMAQRGGDLHHLAKVLETVGVARARASYIAHYLGKRSSSLMRIAKMRSAGLKDGKWMYSAASCYATNSPSDIELARDVAHRSADGKTFELEKGLMLEGKWQFPGLEPG